ncbi:acyltransferase [Marinobacter adhaerens]|uniref:acyltransferase n=1 Tax=Marinobacter adhaerens TaxID=1033846 RepID=UPI001C57839C|nr:acyltransferase [Marinobacter adhaerens]MBW3226015.1 acyltransferase [Marinobacter adhaerens]
MDFILAFINFIDRGWRKLVRAAYKNQALNMGLKLGEGTLLVGDQSFGSEPFLITIGENCLITDGVRFVTHDGSIQVPLIKNGEDFEDVYSNKSTFSRIVIGDNVFIGVNSIILPGTNLGDDSIVAAGAVVKGSFPDGVVIGGNPSKIICSTQEYFDKNKSNILSFSSEKPRRDQIDDYIRSNEVESDN